LPILSVVFLVIFVYILLRKDTCLNRYTTLFMISCVFRIYWFQGYFFRIGQMEISSLANVADYILLVYSVYLVLAGKIKLNTRTTRAALFFITVICVEMFYEMVNPYDGALLAEQNYEINWDRYVDGSCSMYAYEPPMFSYLHGLREVIVFSFEVLVFKQICNRNWLLNLYMQIIGWLKYGICYGYFEFFMKNIIGNLNFTYDLSAILLGVNESSVFTEASIRDGIFYSLQGLTREPSHFNIFLFNVCLLMLFGNTLKRIAKQYGWSYPMTYTNTWLLMCLFLMLLTGGFSSVWLLFIIGCVALLLRIRENDGEIILYVFRNKLALVSFVMIGGVFISIIVQNDYLFNRFIDAVSVVEFLSDSNGLVGVSGLIGSDGIRSTIARFVSIYEGLIVFIDRPLFGLSYGIQYVHDFSIQYLSNIGIVGVYAMYKMLGTSNNSLSYDRTILFLIFMIGGLPITICPIGLAVYWVLYFEATTFYMNGRRQ